ncbi:hypothetical protein AC1031_000487 [Aphanomyces cochlioides]|nr:hypothetical protein AC1031_000487 [Aphanomyces cochlioides]
MMAESSYLPSLLRNMRWGHMNEKEKHLREPLLSDASTDDSSDSEENDDLNTRPRQHVVITVEPKLTRSERLLRSGWSFMLTRQQHMNAVLTVETTHDIVNKALMKLAWLTVAAVSMLLLALYRQAA